MSFKVIRFCIILLFTVLFSTQSFGSILCVDIFSRELDEANVHLAQRLSQDIAVQSQKVLENVGEKGTSKRGYAILIATMVGSAAMTTYLGTKLPPELQFTSVFIAQVSTLGVFVFGAPIWEPLSSRFRKWAYGISTDTLAASNSSKMLEATWLKTQESYSLNAQMSRNIISQFIFTTKENFYQAYRAHAENNPVYSADQIAEAAYRMRILFKDVSTNDSSVASAVNAAFTNHVIINREFVSLVWSRLEKIDSESSKAENQSYYSEVLESWLKTSQIKN